MAVIENVIKRGATLTEQVSDWLADQIINGELSPGAQVNESIIAERLGISRSPLREALRILEKEGLVRVVPHRGVFVNDLSPQDCADLYACRSVLEGFLVRLAVPIMTPKQVRTLSKLLREMERAATHGDSRAYQEFNAEFHMTLYACAPNETAATLVQLLWRKTMRYRALLFDRHEHVKLSLKTHKELMNRIEAGDPEKAEQALHQVLDRGLTSILEVLETRLSTNAPEPEAEL